MPKTNVTVELTTCDGNAFAIMGRVGREMRRAGIDQKTIDDFYKEARSGDYDHVLQTCMDYVEVE